MILDYQEEEARLGEVLLVEEIWAVVSMGAVGEEVDSLEAQGEVPSEEGRLDPADVMEEVP